MDTKIHPLNTNSLQQNYFQGDSQTNKDIDIPDRSNQQSFNIDQNCNNYQDDVLINDNNSNIINIQPEDSNNKEIQDIKLSSRNKRDSIKYNLEPTLINIESKKDSQEKLTDQKQNEQNSNSELPNDVQQLKAISVVEDTNSPQNNIINNQIQQNQPSQLQNNNNIPIINPTEEENKDNNQQIQLDQQQQDQQQQRQQEQRSSNISAQIQDNNNTRIQINEENGSNNNNNQTENQPENQQQPSQQTLLNDPQYQQEQQEKIEIITQNILRVQNFTLVTMIYKIIYMLYGCVMLAVSNCSQYFSIILAYVVIDTFDFIYQLAQNINCKRLITNLKKDNSLIHTDLYAQVYLQALKKDNTWVDIEEVILSKNVILFIMVEVYVILYILLFIVSILKLFFSDEKNNCDAYNTGYLYIHLIWGCYLTAILLYLILIVLIYPWYCLARSVCTYYNQKEKDKKKKQFMSDLCTNSQLFSKIKEEINSNECAICLQEYENQEQITILDCGQQKNNHHFHIDCLKEWLSNYRSVSCPICRKQFINDQNDNNQDQQQQQIPL